MRGHTRDGTRFALLFEENVNYAFRRNFWALKLIALTVAACSLSIGLGDMAADYARTGADPTIEAAVATGLVVLYALFIVIRVNRDWVKLAAEAHAQQLLAACIREKAWLADSPPGRGRGVLPKREISCCDNENRPPPVCRLAAELMGVRGISFTDVLLLPFRRNALGSVGR